jgi:hypothetical protein
MLLKQEIGWLNEVVRAKKPRKLPVVTHFRRPYKSMDLASHLILQGSGLRGNDATFQTESLPPGRIPGAGHHLQPGGWFAAVSRIVQQLHLSPRERRGGGKSAVVEPGF